MKLPRDLSGAARIQHLCRHFNYRQAQHRGSYIVLQTSVPRLCRLVMRRHSGLRLGTLNAILRGAGHGQGDCQRRDSARAVTACT